ncbi:unnamed protein product [Darwinula stevensoni]|uniref:Calpain catalytic domain-containing protein n=1 Tax=Darwinula stevensoni TaxID=69355 RepID=A0A7R8X4S2_9CRUS|nr:unnamed protein product [Darwinula stevensoni]CAG0880005.1 unnamed protein product [Darwinula stevensoni]
MGCNSSQPDVQGNGEIPNSTKTADRRVVTDNGSIENGIDVVEVPPDWEWIPEFQGKAVIKPVKREKYLDTKFPPEPGSLFFSRDLNGVEWKRPNELVNDPELEIGGSSRSDVLQGKLGDCWFLSSCAAVAGMQKILDQVIPPNQSLFGEDHKGIVFCRFWRYGDWQPVYVDDTLPTLNSKLVFGHCSDQREFWLPILEKAYAKVHGSYESLEGGKSLDALVDLTGGIAEFYDLHDLASASEETQKAVFDRLVKAMNQQNAFVTSGREGVDVDVEDGLVNGHAYTVTGAAYIPDGQSGQVRLIRVRNPWGNATEWTGAWSDSDERWDQVDPEVKAKIGQTQKADGEFWMSFQDFCSEFRNATVCTLGPDFDEDGTTDPTNDMVLLHGEWVPGKTAGGCQNDFNSYAKNPQYLMKVTETDSGGEICAVLIGLMQKYRRERRKEGITELDIGFTVYKVEDSGRLKGEDLATMSPFMSSGAYTNLREVVANAAFPPGDYIIIPCTYDADQEAQFMIRAYSEKPITITELQ